MTRKFVCDCGDLQFALFDANGLIDRAFEGVYFRLSFDAADNLQIIIEPDAADFFDDYNAPKHYQSARNALDDLSDEYVKEYASCPTCQYGGNVRVVTV